LPFSDLKLFYIATAAEGSALMMADRQLKVDFSNRKPGAKKSKYEVKTGTGSGFSWYFRLGKVKIAQNCY